MVDGGSTDGTVELCRAHDIRVVGQVRPGRGEAFRVGASVTGGEAIVFFSPDGNEDPSDIPRLFALIDDGADIAIASRFLPGARNEEDDRAWPFRKWVNQAFTVAANLIWNRGPRVTDTINGFRAIRRDVFHDLSLQSIGYTIEFEMTIRAMKARRAIRELPTVEGHRIGGETKAPSLRTGVVFARFFLAELFRGGGHSSRQ